MQSFLSGYLHGEIAAGPALCFWLLRRSDPAGKMIAVLRYPLIWCRVEPDVGCPARGRLLDMLYNVPHFAEIEIGRDARIPSIVRARLVFWRNRHSKRGVCVPSLKTRMCVCTASAETRRVASWTNLQFQALCTAFFRRISKYRSVCDSN